MPRQATQNASSSLSVVATGRTDVGKQDLKNLQLLSRVRR